MTEDVTLAATSAATDCDRGRTADHPPCTQRCSTTVRAAASTSSSCRRPAAATSYGWFRPLAQRETRCHGVRRDTSPRPTRFRSFRGSVLITPPRPAPRPRHFLSTATAPATLASGDNPGEAPDLRSPAAAAAEGWSRVHCHRGDRDPVRGHAGAVRSLSTRGCGARSRNLAPPRPASTPQQMSGRQDLDDRSQPHRHAPALHPRLLPGSSGRDRRAATQLTRCALLRRRRSRDVARKVTRSASGWGSPTGAP